jgi:hypothetical protein
MLAGFWADAKWQYNNSDCSDLKASITIDATNSVKVNVAGIQGKMRIHLIKENGYAKKDISESQLINLESGNYTIVIVDQRKSVSGFFCQKHLEFTIK